MRFDLRSLGYQGPMAVKRAIGVVPQEIALYEDLTALENLNFWGQMYGLSGKDLSTALMRCWNRLI
jgi:ABC-2 type transport system ATP-binding protein